MQYLIAIVRERPTCQDAQERISFLDDLSGSTRSFADFLGPFPAQERAFLERAKTPSVGLPPFFFANILQLQ